MQMTPREIPSGPTIRPSLSIPGVPGRQDLVVDGPRGTVAARLLPGTDIDVGIEMQYHGSLKPSGDGVTVRVLPELPRAALRHGGTVVMLGTHAVEYAATENAHWVWFTDAEGHPEPTSVKARLTAGTDSWEKRGLASVWTVRAEDAHARWVELEVELGLGESSTHGRFSFPPGVPPP